MAAKPEQVDEAPKKKYTMGIPIKEYMKSKSKAAILIESLLAPSFEEFAELVFRDYDRKYNKWMNSGSKPPQPALEPALKSAYKKYIGYNSPEFVIPTGGYLTARLEGLERDDDNVWRVK